MNESLLFLHAVGFAIVIGAALYDRCYIVRNIRRARDSRLERDLMRIYLSTSALFGVGVLLTLGSGIGLTLLHGDGFFTFSAIGLKQWLFLAIGLAFPFYIVPIMVQLNRLLDGMPDASMGVSEPCRFLFKRLSLVLDVIILVNLLILAIAIWKPVLPIVV